MAAITLAASFFGTRKPRLPPFQETFDPRLATLDTVDDILFALDRELPNATPMQKLDAADALLRVRFVHGYSYFRVDQNWVAAGLRLAWDDLASPVRPDDILRFRRAACSQQAMVFQEIAHRLGFHYATAGAPSHFLATVRIDGQWWIYDANREMRARRYPLQWLVSGDARLDSVYGAQLGKQLRLDARAGRITVAHLNRTPAAQAALLHQLSEWISRYGWGVLLLLWSALRLVGHLVRRNSGATSSLAPAAE